MKDEWAGTILKRFEGRENLGKEELFRAYFEPQGLNEKDVLECFEQIEAGYLIPVGVLRPDDSLSKLTERVTTSNPLKWFCWLGRNEFSDDDLSAELRIRLTRYGTQNEWDAIDTFQDLILAWCGEKPSQL